MITILYDIIIKPIELIFDFIFMMFQNHPGIAIVAISIVMNLLALPLYKRADKIQEDEKNKTLKMKPWVDHIKRTFKGDERYMMLNHYYKIEGYKPIYSLRSVFPLLLQIPFFIAGFHYLSSLPFLQGVSFLFLNDLGSPDQLFLIGDFSINILPIAMTLINIAAAYVYLKDSPLKDKITTYGIAAIFLVLLYNSPSGLVLYWTLNQVFSLCKNIFMKIITNEKIRFRILFILSLLLTIAFSLYYIFIIPSHKSLNRILIACFLCIIPLIVYYLHNKKIILRKQINTLPSRNNVNFILSGCLVSIFMGLYIPVSTINSDPASFLSKIISPYGLTFENILIYVGFFIFWLGIYYLLSPKTIRALITMFLWFFSCMILLNFFVFFGDYGTLSNSYVFDNEIKLGLFEVLANIFCVLLLFVVCVVIYRKWPHLLTYFYVVLLTAFLCMSGYCLFNIYNTISGSNNDNSYCEEINNTTKKISLSKNGTNVLFFIIDRAEGDLLPYILQEKPELKDIFSGFTFYPNSLSYGSFTKTGMPGLCGGHDYSPYNIDARIDETLVDKHDEALSVLPTIFSNEGYNVTICNSCNGIGEGYGNEKIRSTMYPSDKTKIFQYDNDSLDYISPNYNQILQNRTDNTFYYCIFRTFPVVLRNLVYSSGNYLHTEHCKHSEKELHEFSYLSCLSTVTNITNDSNNNFVRFYSMLPHENLFKLRAPDYSPSSTSTDNHYSTNEHIINDQTLSLDSINKINTYGVNMATYIQIANWLIYLKDNNVYDNTRIVIASDHGSEYKFNDSLVLDNGYNIAKFNCTLLIKDFNCNDPFNISNNFMTNADVPYVLTKDIINNPVNPFTNNKLSNSDTFSGFTVLYPRKIKDLNCTENLFNVDKALRLRLRNKNIYDKSAWEEIN